LLGTRQRLEIEIPFNAPANGATRLFTDDGALPAGGNAVIHTLAPCDQYTLQGDAFAQVIRGELPLPYGLDDAIQNMHIIDALFRSEQRGSAGGHKKLPPCGDPLITPRSTPKAAALAYESRRLRPCRSFDDRHRLRPSCNRLDQSGGGRRQPPS
jgi:hypothetical protein